MSQLIRFVPRDTLDAQRNLSEFIALLRTYPALLDGNSFDDNAWSIVGLQSKGSTNNYVYFCQLGVEPRQYYTTPRAGRPAQVPETLLMREPLRSFAKAMLIYLHVWKRCKQIPQRLAAFRFLDAALYELSGASNPTTLTPEVLNRACALAVNSISSNTSYALATTLGMVYETMVELGLLAVSSTWQVPLSHPQKNRTRVGKQFDEERRKKLPSPLALEALAAIFNSDTGDPAEVFSSSVCALMLCDPDRATEMLFAPRDLIAGEWTAPDTGEVGLALRWFPVKGAAPMTKTVIPDMREVAIRAVDRLKRLSEPARRLALWYEANPNCIYLPTALEHLRAREEITLDETYQVLFGVPLGETTKLMRSRARKWLTSKGVPFVATMRGANSSTTIKFRDLERAVLAQLPSGFPIMDSRTGMRYSEALCLARVAEFRSSTDPQHCAFDRIDYHVLKVCLKTQGSTKSVFEKRDYRDESGDVLSLSTHQMRHYLNTVVRESGDVSEEQIALWSGRNVRQNAPYNHESDRDVIAKYRLAVGDPKQAVGPFADMDKRVFVNRSDFACIKIVTAHTSEFGHCIHDYAQSPCPYHTDCTSCNELVCIKGDMRAERNLRAAQREFMRLDAEARAAFTDEVLGSAEWFEYQTTRLSRINALVAILDDPNVPEGAVIQLSGVSSPSRIAMAREKRAIVVKPISQSITCIQDVYALLSLPQASKAETSGAT